MTQYLKPYEIQHPDTSVEPIIKRLQELTQTNELTLTKEGLSALINSCVTYGESMYELGYNVAGNEYRHDDQDLSDSYDSGYESGYADGVAAASKN